MLPQTCSCCLGGQIPHSVRCSGDVWSSITVIRPQVVMFGVQLHLSGRQSAAFSGGKGEFGVRLWLIWIGRSVRRCRERAISWRSYAGSSLQSGGCPIFTRKRLGICFRVSAPRVISGCRQDFERRVRVYLKRGCKSSWWKHRHGPTIPGQCGCPNLPPTGEWQKNGARYDTLLAW